MLPLPDGVRLVPMVAVFEASQSTQQAASIVFLSAYALARLGVGVLADSVPLPTMYAAFGLGQIAACLALGACVWSTSAIGFICSMVLLGCSLAGTKVVLSITALRVYGASTFSNAFEKVEAP